jgi:hypothetical protein
MKTTGSGVTRTVGRGGTRSGTPPDDAPRTYKREVYHVRWADGLRPGLILVPVLLFMLSAFIFALISTAVLTEPDGEGKVVWMKMIVSSATCVLSGLATNLAASALV